MTECTLQYTCCFGRIYSWLYNVRKNKRYLEYWVQIRDSKFIQRHRPLFHSQAHLTYLTFTLRRTSPPRQWLTSPPSTPTMPPRRAYHQIQPPQRDNRISYCRPSRIMVHLTLSLFRLTESWESAQLTQKMEWRRVWSRTRVMMLSWPTPRLIYDRDFHYN